MDKTRTHDVRAARRAAPGSPPELSTIVDKALAFDAERSLSRCRRARRGRAAVPRRTARRRAPTTRRGSGSRGSRGGTAASLSVIAHRAVAVAVTRVDQRAPDRQRARRARPMRARRPTPSKQEVAERARSARRAQRRADRDAGARACSRSTRPRRSRSLKQLPRNVAAARRGAGDRGGGGGARRDVRDADHHRDGAAGRDVRGRPPAAPGLARRHAARVRSRSPSPDRVAVVRPIVARGVGHRRQAAGDESQGSGGDLRSEGRHRRAARVARDRHRLRERGGRPLPRQARRRPRRDLRHPDADDGGHPVRGHCRLDDAVARRQLLRGVVAEADRGLRPRRQGADAQGRAARDRDGIACTYVGGDRRGQGLRAHARSEAGVDRHPGPRHGDVDELSRARAGAVHRFRRHRRLERRAEDVPPRHVRSRLADDARSRRRGAGVAARRRQARLDREPRARQRRYPRRREEVAARGAPGCAAHGRGGRRPGRSSTTSA